MSDDADARYLWSVPGMAQIHFPSPITDLTLDDAGQLIVVTETGMTRLRAEDLR